MENPFSLFEQRRRQRDEERLQLNKRIMELNTEGEKDAIAVGQLRKLYPNGFPTMPEDAETDRESAVADAVEPAPPPPASAVQMQQRGGDMTVKDMAFAILRDAYPNGLSAAQIKGKAFLRYQKHINPNTLTVSLVRLKPWVKCEDRTWFYVKPIIEKAAINGASGAEQKKSPEAPGLL